MLRLQVLTTTPMVPFRLSYDGKPDVDLSSPHDFPKDKTYSEVLEPTVNCTIITPDRYTGQVLQLCASKRGDLLVRNRFIAGVTRPNLPVRCVS